ncbi:hypothetical protein ABPG74_020497 [Tetrahymena malaccensis]
MGACLSVFGGKPANDEDQSTSSKLLGDDQKQEDLDNDEMGSTKPNSEETVRIQIKGNNEDEQNNQQKVVLSDFEILKVIGEGSFGKVFMVQKKDDGKIYAMKQLRKSNLTKQHQKLKTIEEKNIMVNMKSPFIVQLKYAFQTTTKLYFVMDFMQGGEMFYHIRKAKYFKEDVARFYISELVLALEYLHSKDTIYRDLKPENILLGADGHIKICDFGLSKQGVKDSDKTKTICGTPEYLAPEILLGQPHGKEVDWYSLGCVLYEFLSGAPPFYSRDKQQMYQQRINSDIQRKPQFQNDAWDLIQLLLAKNPKDRLNTAAQVKSHPFFQSVDWEKLMNKDVRPPFILKFNNEQDTRYISNEFVKQAVQNTPYTPNVGGLAGANQDFDGFTYQGGVSINNN